MDIVICNFPPMLPWYLPAAPAVLLGACRWLGLTSAFVDFNINAHQKNLDVDKWVDEVLDKKSKIVALSIFSYKSRPYALQFAEKLKQKNPDVIIIAGGSGIRDSLNGELQIDFAHQVNSKVIDYHIDGDGEYNFPAVLANIFKLLPIEKFEPINFQYYADYSKYDLSFYSKEAKKNKTPIFIPITGSKGCVRNCTFCDVPARWNFSYRPPSLIAAEIKNIMACVQDRNIHIHFTDSLVNGSMPVFDEMLDLFVDIKKEYSNFNWGGQFIIRRAKQSTAEYWKKIADSGAKFLEIGVETGSDRLRAEMKKHFSNFDLNHSIKLMLEYNITCILLMFTGMPTETEQDFNETLNLLSQLKIYKKIICQIELGYLTTINPKTPLYEESVKDKNMILTKNPIIWFNKNNPKLTFNERILRRKKFEEHAHNCGFTTAWDTHLQLSEAEQSYYDNLKIINLIEKQK